MVSRHSDPSRSFLPVHLRFLLLITGCGLFLVGCGYHPYGIGSLPPEIQRLHLAALANDTWKPGLQGVVSAAILRRLHQDGRVRLTLQDDADSVLGGTLNAYENEGIAFSQEDIARRFRLRVHLVMQLTERRGGKVLLKEEIVGEAFYTSGSGAGATRAAEEEATQRAAQDLAVQVVMRLMEGL